jgi:hypothetical protein
MHLEIFPLNNKSVSTPNLTFLTYDLVIYDYKSPDKNMARNVKIKIYKTITLPVVLYVCETWSLTLREERRLRVASISYAVVTNIKQ